MGEFLYYTGMIIWVTVGLTSLIILIDYLKYVFGFGINFTNIVILGYHICLQRDVLQKEWSYYPVRYTIINIPNALKDKNHKYHGISNGYELIIDFGNIYIIKSKFYNFRKRIGSYF